MFVSQTCFHSVRKYEYQVSYDFFTVFVYNSEGFLPDSCRTQRLILALITVRFFFLFSEKEIKRQAQSKFPYSSLLVIRPLIHVRITCFFYVFCDCFFGLNKGISKIITAKLPLLQEVK